MNKLKLLISFLIIFSILNCSKINEKLEQKVYEQRREAIEKIDSVMRSTYKDSVSKDMEKELREIDSIRSGSDSTIRRIEKNTRKLQNQKSSK